MSSDSKRLLDFVRSSPCNWMVTESVLILLLKWLCFVWGGTWVHPRVRLMKLTVKAPAMMMTNMMMM